MCRIFCLSLITSLSRYPPRSEAETLRTSSPQHPPIAPLPALLSTRDFWHFFLNFYFMKMSPSKRIVRDGDYRAELPCPVVVFPAESLLLLLRMSDTHTHIYTLVSFSWAIYVDKDVQHVCVSVRYILGLDCLSSPESRSRSRFESLASRVRSTALQLAMYT